MFTKRKIAIALGIIILLGGMLMFGCHRGPHHFFQASPEKKAEWMVKRISNELDLNDAQKQVLERIKVEILAKRQAFKLDHQEIHQTLVQQVKSTEIDQNVVNKLFEDKEAQFKEMRTFMIAKFAEFHQQLDAKQKLELAEKMEKIHGHFQHD